MKIFINEMTINRSKILYRVTKMTHNVMFPHINILLSNIRVISHELFLMKKQVVNDKNIKFTIVNDNDEATIFNRVTCIHMKNINEDRYSDLYIYDIENKIFNSLLFNISITCHDKPIYESNFSRREKIRSFE